MTHLLVLLLFFQSASTVIRWTKATDDVSPSALLLYEVRRSSSANISTVAAAEANGVIVMPYARDVDQVTVAGLKFGATYYFTVIVKDEAGNKSVYRTGKFVAPKNKGQAKYETYR